MSSQEEIESAAGRVAPSTEALRVVRLLPFGWSDNDCRLSQCMPSTRQRDAQDFMASYIRGCVTIPFDTPFDDAERTLLSQMPARLMYSTTVKKHFDPGQREVNKRISTTVYDCRHGVRAVVAVMQQFGSVERFALDTTKDGARGVVLNASAYLQRSYRNGRPPGFKNVVRKFGTGLKYFEGYKRKIQQVTQDPQLTPVDIVNDQCKEEVKRVEEQRGSGHAPDPFYIRDNHSSADVRAAYAVFCVIPMRFQHFSQHLDIHGVGWKLDNTGDLVAVHGVKYGDWYYKVADNLMNYADASTVNQVMMMHGKQSLVRFIRSGLGDTYGESYDWTSLRHGWEMHVRLIDGYDDDSYTRDGLHNRSGHSAKMGRNMYCKLHGFATPIGTDVTNLLMPEDLPDLF